MTDHGAVLTIVLGGAALVCLVAAVWLGARVRRLGSLVNDEQANRAGLEDEVTRKDKLLAELNGRNSQIKEGINALTGALWDLEIPTRQLHASDLFLEMTGYRAEDFSSDLAHVRKFIHPEDYASVRQTLQDYLARVSDQCGLEMRFKFNDGEYHWVQSRALATWDAEGRPYRIVGSLIDITEKIVAEEERDRLFNLSVDMLSIGGFDGSFHQLNPAWVRVLGWSRDDLLGAPILHFVHEHDSDVMKETLNVLKEGDPVRGAECRFRCRDGTFRWLSWSSFPYPDRELIFSVVRDVSEQKEAETKVMEYQDRLRSLSSQLALVEDRQRQELANAIHDGLAQELFGIRAMVTLLKFPERLDDYQGKVGDILKVLDDTMSNARSLSFELFPPVLHEVGLEAALSWLAHQFNLKTGLPCHVTVEGEGEELPEDLRAMAYQSARELLNNVYKHAEATEVSISINHVPNYLTLLVDDNGVGFEISQDQSPRIRREAGFGLFSIRERLLSVGGRMLVDTHPGRGCRVFLSIPRHP